MSFTNHRLGRAVALAFLASSAACSAPAPVAPTPPQPEVVKAPAAPPHYAIRPAADGEAQVVRLVPQGPLEIDELDRPLLRAIAGLEPVMVLPEATRATQARPAAKGAPWPSWLANKVIADPAGRLALVGLDGELSLLATDRSAAKRLGKLSRAVFGGAGRYLFAWEDEHATLFDTSSGAPIAQREGVSTYAWAAILNGPDALIELDMEGGARVSELPSLKPRFEASGGRSSLFERARRLAVDGSGPPGDGRSHLSVFDIDSGRRLAQLPGYVTGFPQIAFSADAKKLAWALDGVEVIEIATGRHTILERGPMPMHTRYEPSAVAFTADGAHVCVEQEGVTRILPKLRARPGRQATCFILERPGIARDKEAVIVEVPVSPGFTPLRGSHGLYFNVKGAALSPDRSTVAVIEEARVPEGKPAPTRLVIADAASAKVRRVIPIGKRPAELPFWNLLSVDFSDDGRVVGVGSAQVDVVGNFGGSFDVATGAPATEPPTEPPPDLPGEERDPKAAFRSLLRVAGLTEPSATPGGTRVESMESTGGKTIARVRRPGGEWPVSLELRGADLPSTPVFRVAEEGHTLLLLSNLHTLDVYSLDDGRRVARVAATSKDGAIAFLEGGAIDLRGQAVTEGLACRSGDRLDAFEGCKERWRVEGGLERAIAGETSYLLAR